MKTKKNFENPYDIIVNKCLCLKEKESLLIVTDDNLLDIANDIKKAAENVSSDVLLLKKDVGKRHGEEPLAEISDKMLSYDTSILITTNSLSHTDARRKASFKGRRIISMPGITREIIERCIDLDYENLGVVHRKLRNVLKNVNEIRVVTGKGTDIVTTVRNTRGTVYGIFKNPGDFGNLPTGEVDSGVVLEKTNGKIVVDASFGGLGKLNSDIIIEIRDGVAVSIEGERSDELMNILNSAGKDSYKLAEFGIGTNPKAKVTGKTLEDEKVLGTVHFALGNDLTYGGNNDVSVHLDGIIKNPKIFVDGKLIMKDKIFLI